MSNWGWFGLRRVGRRRRRKKVIPVVSPPVLGEVEVAYVLAGDEDSLVGRRVEVQLSGLTSLPTHTFIKCRLRIVRVEDGVAYTEFDGMEYFREYVRALFMKGTSYVDVYRDVGIGDSVFRVLTGVFTPKRINTSRKRAIRREVYNVFNRYLRKDVNYFIRDALYGVIDTYIHKASKKIYPVRWAGIIKIKRVRG